MKMEYIALSIPLLGALLNIYNLIIGLKQINYKYEIKDAEINIKYLGHP